MTPWSRRYSSKWSRKSGKSITRKYALIRPISRGALHENVANHPVACCCTGGIHGVESHRRTLRIATSLRLSLASATENEIDARPKLASGWRRLWGRVVHDFGRPQMVVSQGSGLSNGLLRSRCFGGAHAERVAFTFVGSEVPLQLMQAGSATSTTVAPGTTGWLE